MSEEKKRKYIYTGYNPKNAKHVDAYRKKHMKLIQVSFNKDFYTDEVEPILTKLNISASSFARTAVEHEIERMKGEKTNE